jgi:hypothetical protein
MAMLNDAKAAKTGKESGEAGSPKAEHKKKKHPKTGVESGEAGTPAAQDAEDDSSGDSDNSTQPSGQGGAQETYQTPDQTTQIQQSGPPPVVNPAAPGAGDESGGSDTPGQAGGQGQDPDEDQASDQADQSQSQDSDQDGDQDQGGGSDPDADQDQDQSGAGAPPGGAGAPPAQGATPPAAGNDAAAGKEAAKGAHLNADGLPQIPMSPALKEEYQRINMALHKALYQLPGDKAATGVLKSLFPQGPAKIKGVVMASLALITQIHKQLKFPPQLILPFTKDVVSHVMDLGQQVKKIQYSEQECTAILGATLESVMRVFGVSQKQVQALGQHVPKSVLATHVQKYQAAHKFAKSAIDQNNQGWNHPHLAGPGGAPGGQPPAAQGGPPPAAQGGAPPAAQGGAPPAAAAPPPSPPPAQQGGMLSQAAGGQ